MRVVEALVRPSATLRIGQVEIALRTSARAIDVLPSERTRFGDAVGRSLAMRTVFGVLEFMAPSTATILLEGETGTGKDVLARAIVRESRRKKAPFIVLDCGAITPGLLESELFGHEKGAFTGASTARRGAFEAANGGTILIDEVGELPLDLQPKLLRVLEAREVKRLGSSEPSKVDVRIIAATKRNLVARVAEGAFREDLYSRLAVVPIKVPSLRERRDDIPLLVTSILGSLGAETMHVSDEAMNGLLVREWRGNVRELRNAIERAVHLARGMGDSEIDASHFPTPQAEESVFRFDGTESFDETTTRLQRAYARWLVARHGSTHAAAEAAEIEVARLTALAIAADD